LTDNVTHSGAGNDVKAAGDLFGITVTDPEGGSRAVDVNVAIQDDAPVIDVAAGTSTVSGLAEALIGTVTVDFGADGSGGLQLNGTAMAYDSLNNQYVLDDGYGSYRVTSDGKLYFTSNGTWGDVSIIISAEDADGDNTSGDPLSIKVVDADIDVDVGSGSGGALVSESGLATGTTPGVGNVSEWITLNLNAGVRAVTGSYTGTYGTLVVRDNGDGTYSYQYTLTNPVTHSAGGGAQIAQDIETINVPIYDSYSNTGNAAIHVDIKDDVPTLEFTGSGANVEGLTETLLGTVAINFGADGSKYNNTVLIGGYAGTYNAATNEYTYPTLTVGDFRVTADGKVYFKSRTGQPESFSIPVMVVDADGDTVTYDLGINVVAKDIDVEIGDGSGGALVSESGLAAGTTPGVGSTSGWIKLDLGTGIKAVTGSFQGAHGTLVVRDNGDDTYSYQYTLTGAIKTTPSANDGAQVAQDADSVVVSIYDIDGNTGTATVHVDIKDDVPTLSLAPTGTQVLGIHETWIGTVTVKFGADGEGGYLVNGAPATYNAVKNEYTYSDANGTYRIAADGKVYFAASVNADRNYSIKISAVDGDGDVTDAVGGAISIATKEALLQVFPTDTVVHEAGLNGGTGIDWLANDGTTTADVTASGTFTLGASVTNFTFTMGTQSSGVSGNVGALGAVGETVTFNMTGPSSILSVTNLGNGNYAYTYTLTGPMTHNTSAGGVGEIANNNLNISVSNGKGETATGKGEIQVVNDELTNSGNDFTVTMPDGPAGVVVTIILDWSGSMVSSTSGGRTLWAIATEAVINMLNKYQDIYPEITPFEINIALFSLPSSGPGSVPMTFNSIEEAKAFVLSLPVAAGGTPYVQGLNDGQKLIEASIARHPDYEQKVYFMTDGAPQDGGAPQTWKNFVTGQYSDLLDVYGIGIGTGATKANITPVLNPNDPNDIYIGVTNPSDLGTALLSTLPTSTGSLFGYVDVNGEYQTLVLGADQGFTLTKVTFDGRDYVFSGTTVSIEVRPGITLTVNKNGSFSVQTPGLYPSFSTALKLEITDADGDKVVIDKEINFKFPTYDAPITAYDNEANPILVQNAGTNYDYRLTNFTNPTNSLGIPTGATGASAAAVRAAILAEANASVTSSDAQIIIRATSNIDAYMPLKADGTKLTMQELFNTHRVSTGDTYQDAGFITLPTFTVNSASTVVVRFYWDGGINTRDGDIAMWVLVDATGKVVKSGRFAS
ncbi:MAG: beta strand repeat-containing protein, partial [Azovibrio sp.]